MARHDLVDPRSMMCAALVPPDLCSEALVPLADIFELLDLLSKLLIQLFKCGVAGKYLRFDEVGRSHEQVRWDDHSKARLSTCCININHQSCGSYESIKIGQG
jgi:hypothetical protein